MEKKIKEYEKFIEKATREKLSEKEKANLAKYHSEMMESFQHERIIHLIVMLFFTLISVIFLFIAAWTTVSYKLHYEMLPLYVLTILLIILTGFYVKHYYFLENHIQGLYKYTAKLNDIKE
ncbi:hypothetical protein J6X04_00430 [Candidatus Saccharibacteria bacterium]|nr:hypothetical protein [Candidatus Saccharibacteria bacterium]